MTTTIHPHPSPSRHPRWEAIKRSFTQSNYITDFWNWLMTLMSKAAELVLFGSVLYSGYQLLPNITHAPAQVDAIIFVIQQAALDIGGMGLLKLAKRAGLPKDAFPVRVGITLVVLMILNVVLASLKQALPVIPAAVFVWVETVLLIARAVMAVLFGHAIHALREEYSESTVTVKEARELREEIEGVASDLAQTRLHFQQQLARELASLHEQLTRELVHCDHRFHTSLHESASQLASNLHNELAHELTLLRESLHQEKLAQDIQHVKEALEQLQRRQEAVREHRPIALRALPSVGAQESGQASQASRPRRQPALQDAAGEKFDARAFVFSCLQERATCKLKDIQHLARTQGQELSEATISRYRKQFFAQHASSLQAASTYTSFHASASAALHSESEHESFQGDERKVVGE